jgi:hypothetical protein
MTGGSSWNFNPQRVARKPGALATLWGLNIQPECYDIDPPKIKVVF